MCEISQMEYEVLLVKIPRENSVYLIWAMDEVNVSKHFKHFLQVDKDLVLVASTNLETRRSLLDDLGMCSPFTLRSDWYSFKRGCLMRISSVLYPGWSLDCNTLDCFTLIMSERECPISLKKPSKYMSGELFTKFLSEKSVGYYMCEKHFNYDLNPLEPRKKSVGYTYTAHLFSGGEDCVFDEIFCQKDSTIHIAIQDLGVEVLLLRKPINLLTAPVYVDLWLKEHLFMPTDLDCSNCRGVCGVLR